MGKRRELEDRLHTLGEIHGILGGMKNLALLETQKLTRFLATQRRVVDSLEAAAGDFLRFHPAALAHPSATRPLYLVVGSERGFCGDFNHALAAALTGHLGRRPEEQPLLLVVGHKLAVTLGETVPVTASLEGPAVAEEVQAVLVHLMDTLRGLQAREAFFCLLDLTVIHHRPGAAGSEVQVRQPFRGVERPGAPWPYPPLLNLEPLAFVAELIDQYLFAVLHELFYSSLMAENLRRYHHMDQAIQRLDKDLAELRVKRNILRQEDITEEIEVLLLSAEALSKPKARGGLRGHARGEKL